jgi:outer membrane protein insertion porin family
MPFAVLLLAALVTAANPAEPPPELLGKPLCSIRFDTNARIDEEGLLRLIPLEVGKPVTSEDLDETRRLLGLKELFRSFSLELQPQEDGAALVIHVKRKRVVRSVEFVGLESIRETEARRLVRIDKSMIFEPELAQAARDRLQERYEKLAYVNAAVTVEYEDVHSEVEVSFFIDEGLPLVVSSVALAGDAGELEAELLKEARDLEGKNRTREAVRGMDQRLIRLLRDEGYYEARVSSEWEATESNKGVVRFTIERGPRFDIQVTGSEKKSRKHLLGLMDLEKRIIITDGTWRELARRMREDYESSGYYRAKVDVQAELNETKQVRFEIDEGRRYSIAKLHFEGNHTFDGKTLRKQFETLPRRRLPWPRSGALVDSVLAEDLKRLRFFYRTQGFRSVKVVEARKDFDEERGRIVLTIVVEEGPRTMLVALDDAEVRALLAGKYSPKLRVGQPLNTELVKADREAITALLLRQGYPEPKVDDEIEQTPAGGTIEATLRWHVEPGTRQTIGKLIIQRNIDTRGRAIRRVVALREDDPLVIDDLLQAQADLYRLGLFRTVSVRPITDDGPVRDVAITVAERPAGIFEVGAGYNTRDGLEGLFEVGYGNIGGMARTVNLRIQASLDPKDFTPDQYLATLGFVEPRLFNTRWRYKSNIVGERSTETVDNFNIERFGFVNIVDRQLARNLNGGMEAQVERGRVFGVAPDAVLSDQDEGSLRTVALTPFLLFDTRDDPFAPRRGLLDSVRLRYGLPALSNVHFTKLLTQHTQFVPLFEGVTFVYSARVGWAHAISGSPFMPIRERFFLGGRTTVRGFGENSIGPRGSEGSEIGGDFSVNTNVELHVPLLYGLEAAFFVDGGGLYLLQCDSQCRRSKGISDAAVTFENFRRSAGLGLRYNTPVGPIALDYGIKLDRRDGESFGRLHFSIGTIF